MKTLSQRARNLYDRIAPQYNDAFPTHSHPEHLKLFTDRLKQGSLVLDVGCAGGRDTNYFKNQGFRAVGVDFSAGQIAYAKSKYPGINFMEADMLKLAELFPQDEFDGIFTYAALDHLKKTDISKAIANFNQILKMNGVLFIVTRKGKGVLWTNDSYSQYFKRRFTLIESDELKKILQRKGFKIEKFDTFPSLTRKNMEFNLVLCSKKRRLLRRFTPRNDKQLTS